MSSPTTHPRRQTVSHGLADVSGVTSSPAHSSPLGPKTSKPGRSFDELGHILHSVAAVADALDMVGLRSQCPRVPLPARTGVTRILGRCRTTLWDDLEGTDPCPYELELQAVDSCQPGDVLIAAAAGSYASGIWGELLSTAARNAGCVGVIVDGGVRDVAKMREMRFPCFARHLCPYDSQHRQRVIDYGCPVQIGETTFHNGDLVIADQDGVVVIPQDVEEQVIDLAIQKMNDENHARQAILNGMPAVEAYDRFGVL
ncbi:MAG: RraA family protein [Planctomycetota bacterium]